MQVSSPECSPGCALSALLWDVDGTLAETEQGGHRLAFNRAMTDAGLSWQWDETTYRQLLTVSGGRERLAHDLERREGRPPEPSRLDDLVTRKQGHYHALVEAGELQLRPGVRRLMAAAAAAGLRQGIVTTSGRDSVQALAEQLLGTLAGALSFWICGEDVQGKKPDPEAYRLALAQLGSDGHGVLAIEDSLNGLGAARAAGLRCLITLGIDSAALPIARFAAATGVVDGLGDPGRPAAVRRGPACRQGLITLSWLEQLMSMP
ncbi:HAD-IA family hydrolase [Cyanobium sp. Morenito 9A2]|uniref:HAD-IA family hydrolase n=1 Tax=Cyanobium sp. Morenito 9A2 TaxID=2823718 RepID=UPI0020CD5923|nr:HAD-IA family hydrolase [Cyanobium sp. Morenito 9A2]MCP9848676.1 HAD-IA family hydrolase [Cyanobium sp. Morenito 9A2]